MSNENVLAVDFGRRRRVGDIHDIQVTLAQRRAKRTNSRIHESLGMLGVELPEFRQTVKELRVLSDIVDEKGEHLQPGFIAEDIRYAEDNFSPHQLQALQRYIPPEDAE